MIQTRKVEMIWEYKSVPLKVSGYDYGERTVEKVLAEVDRFMNEAGSEGWELVNTLDQEKKGYVKLVIAIFKRPKRHLQLNENRIVPVRNSSKPGISHQGANAKI